MILSGALKVNMKNNLVFGSDDAMDKTSIRIMVFTVIHVGQFELCAFQITIICSLRFVY